MKQKIEMAYDDKYISAIATHFSDVPNYFMKEEIEDFNIIHPTGKEDFKNFFNDRDSYTASELNNSNLNGKGGVYYISFAGIKTLYVGETLDFKKRFQQHLKDFNNSKHFNKKLDNAFKKANGLIKFTVLESGRVTEYNKADFKIYCLKRENYYKELFRLNKVGIFNIEDTLHEFYLSCTSLYDSYIRVGDSFLKKKNQRPTCMDDLNEMAQSEFTQGELNREKYRFERIMNSLNNR